MGFFNFLQSFLSSAHVYRYLNQENFSQNVFTRKKCIFLCESCIPFIAVPLFGTLLFRFFFFSQSSIWLFLNYSLKLPSTLKLFIFYYYIYFCFIVIKSVMGYSPFSSFLFVFSLRNVTIFISYSALFPSDFTFMKLQEIVPYKFNKVSMVFIDSDTNSLIACIRLLK